jgi:hypothetical protein
MFLGFGRLPSLVLHDPLDEKIPTGRLLQERRNVGRVILFWRTWVLRHTRLSTADRVERVHYSMNRSLILACTNPARLEFRIRAGAW